MNFVGNETAGMLGLLICKDYVDEVVGYSREFTGFARSLGFTPFRTIGDIDPAPTICVHGTEIFPEAWLYEGEYPPTVKSFPYPEFKHQCINIHPYLYCYKGKNVHPVTFAIKNRNTKASVGAHYMTDKIDEGPVIIEKFKDIKLGTAQEVYQQLYPLYVEVISEILKKFV